jgi:hypothetical protein
MSIYIKPKGKSHEIDRGSDHRSSDIDLILRTDALCRDADARHSQRRVIEHCRRLLKAQDLAAEHRQRLTRLVGLAETELQRLHV